LLQELEVPFSFMLAAEIDLSGGRGAVKSVSGNILAPKHSYPILRSKVTCVRYYIYDLAARICRRQMFKATNFIDLRWVRQVL